MELQVQKILREKGIEYRLIELSSDAYTVSGVMKNSGGDLNPEEICKTIILSGKKTGKTIAVLLRGGDKLVFSKVKKITGEEMAIASVAEVKEASGVEPGAVCPLMLDTELLVDERILELERLNCGSGDHLYGLEFRLIDLSKMTDYKVADLAKVSESVSGV